MFYQWTAAGVLLVFYGCYFIKMLMQHKQGIKTDQLGKGKEGLVKVIEYSLKIISILVPVAEVLSIVLNTSFSFEPVRILGMAAAMAGVGIFIVSVVTMRDNYRAGVSTENKTKLVTNGIYSYSRNPAFLGFDLVYTGILLLFYNPVLLVLSLLAICLFHLQIVNVEEDFLLQAFGDDYIAYRKKTNRYFGKKKAGWNITGVVLGCILVFAVVNFIPTYSLKVCGMTKLEGRWINVYYESEKEAAEDVFALADANAERIAYNLFVEEKQDVNIYIYDNQNTMQQKKYGLIGPLLGLDWYIGDNIGTDVILTSPANPGKVHDYDNNKYAVLHEIVHAYITTFNPDVSLWLTEGTALYLTNGEPFYKEYLESMDIPSFSDTRTNNPIRFSNCGGYTFAHTYMEYLDVTYGWDKVTALLVSEDYEEIYGKTEKEIYEEWVEYITHYE